MLGRRRAVGVRRRLAGACVLAGVALTVPRAQAEEVAEESLRAAFIYNFTLFVEWPGATGTTFDLCVAGARPSGALLGLAGKPAAGRPIRVLQPSRREDMRACRVLYVTGGDNGAWAGVREALAGAPVLTVANGYAGGGGAMINLVMQEGRFTFDIDAAAAQRAGLRISTRLLRLARRVY